MGTNSIRTLKYIFIEKIGSSKHKTYVLITLLFFQLCKT